MENIRHMANSLRALSLDMVNTAQSGHTGAALGLADVLAVLYHDFLKFSPENPAWEGRDRLVFSNGHASALAYAGLHLAGYALPMADLRAFRQLGSLTPGHPEHGHTPGIEATTGPLGQGVAMAVGMALACKKKNLSSTVYCVLGDGCLMEGISHEAFELARVWRLDNLVFIFDDNNITIDGSADSVSKTNILDRMSAYGFVVFSANGHDSVDIHRVLSSAKVATNDTPSFIAMKTHIGRFSPVVDTPKAHGALTNNADVEATKRVMGWTAPAFDIPEDIYTLWQGCAGRVTQINDENIPPALDITKACSALDTLKLQAIPCPTRVASGQCITAVAPYLPQLISGSADLSGSVNTHAPTMETLEHNGTVNGNYIHYGVREHAMGASMNGLALEGFLPIAGTFLTFADYMKEPIRLAAMMQLHTIFVFTHDSIGVGEDGPTHQPIEQLAMLRSIPNLAVYRPADLVETAECWQLALTHIHTPTAMILSRQTLDIVRIEGSAENLSGRGAYILRDAPDEKPAVILMAAGSEVALCVQAQAELLSLGISSRVVSAPCLSLFDAQEEAYTEKVLPQGTPVLAVEAAHPMPWYRYTPHVLGIKTFGASAPASDLFKYFGFTVENVVSRVQKLLK